VYVCVERCVCVCDRDMFIRGENVWGVIERCPVEMNDPG
jgi:hypothetical protein